MVKNEDLKGLKLESFVALDIETTGLNSFSDKIIEIAAVKFENGEIVDNFSMLINPEIKLSDEIVSLTGIEDKDLIDKPFIEDVLPLFFEFIDKQPLVGHNISFDLEFIKYNSSIHGMESDFKSKKIYDTLSLSQIIVPRGPVSYKLSNLKKYFNIESGDNHRALGDSIACGELLLKIVEKSLELNDATVKKLADVALVFESFVKIFILDLANYFAKTSFKRKIGTTINKYHDSFNYIAKDSEPDQNMESILSMEDIIDKIFDKGGLLDKNLSKFEYREEQHIFSKASHRALNEGKILVTEAGTGVGKSFAYLFPSAINSILSDEKVVVTTNTKNLQEQIFYKDIPIVHEQLGGLFSAVILKGRKNYLCLNRFESICKNPTQHLVSDDQAKRFLPLIVWANRTITGDIEENTGFKKGFSYDIWSKVESDSGFCLGKKCRHYNRCFAIGIRKKAFKSNLVIINHSLLFSDIVSENAVLGKYSKLVVDEAHNIENAATSYLGEEFSFSNLRNIINRVITQDNKHGYLKKLEKSILAGIEEKNKVDKFQNLIDQLKDKSRSLHDIGKSFWNEIGEKLYRNSSNYRSNSIKKRFKNSDEVFGGFESEVSKFKSVFEDFTGAIKRINVLLGTLEEGEIPDQDEIKQEFSTLFESSSDLYSTFSFFKDTERENFVFWYDIVSKNNGLNFKLSSAPLDVSPILKKNLYDNLESVILTSATLTIEKRFKYMQKKLGLSSVEKERVETIMLGSPFDHENQLKVITPTFLASPKMSTVYEKDVENVITALAENFDQGTLGLFTSYKMMKSVFYNVSDLFKKKDRVLLMQGKDSTRSDLIKNFKNVKNSFLFGTDSFWEGVDVPGNSLEALLIVKLPFSVPTEPVIEARIEDLEKRGLNSFMHFSVPEAILKFKQGVGRVIRSAEDRGIVYILDSRVINTRWGQAFVNSLPVLPKSPRNMSQLIKITEESFKNE
ncbi:MAG: hypothetical protein CR982_09310 [Candidatus Cloacimonadota bacterium]|nr:MAG: hypothetical protein CR982_09310 [Candidatus Cloacimonadota bacterium]PIE77507.1 MAG: hypothetical protein CSA15_12600 [Candidatus Delongbacteria bacterium]